MEKARQLPVVEGEFTALAPRPGNAETAAKARAGLAAKVVKPTATFAEIPKLWDGYVLLTTQAGAAALLQVSKQTIRIWAKAGKIDVKYTPSGRPRVVVASLWKENPPAWVAEAEAEAAASGMAASQGDSDDQ